MPKLTLVTLYSGEQVLSDSVAWREQCEVKAILDRPLDARAPFFELVAKIRRLDGMEALKKRCFEAEPYYVLELPDRAARNAYTEQVGLKFGWKARATLEEKVRAIWRARKETKTTETA